MPYPRNPALSRNAENKLASAKAEKEDLQKAVEDLRQARHAEAHTPQAPAPPDVARQEEKERRARIQGDNEELRRQLKDAQRSLIALADENEALEEGNAALTRMQASLEQGMVDERKRLLDQQREMEDMLLLQESPSSSGEEDGGTAKDKENNSSKKRSLKKKFKGLVMGRQGSMGRPGSALPPNSPQVPLSPRA